MDDGSSLRATEDETMMHPNEADPVFTTMDAAVVWEPGGTFDLRLLAIARPAGEAVLVRVDAVGLCHADLGARDGDFPVPLPAVLGHEAAGTVAALGDAVRTVKVGDRVVVTFDSCGECLGCLDGRPSQCAHMLTYNFSGGAEGRSTHLTAGQTSVNGSFFGQSSFARYAMANVRNVVPVTTDLPAEVLAPLGCGVQTGVGAVLKVLKPAPDQSIAIWGMGAVGLSGLLAATLTKSSKIIAIDTKPQRLRLARELGAHTVIDASRDDPVAAVIDASDGGVSGAVECSGSVEAFTGAIRSCRTGGTTVVVGAPPFGSAASVDVADIVNNSKRVQGTVEGDSMPQRDIPKLVGMIESGQLPVDRLITAFPFADINEAATAMSGGHVVKPVLVFSR